MKKYLTLLFGFVAYMAITAASCGTTRPTGGGGTGGSQQDTITVHPK